MIRHKGSSDNILNVSVAVIAIGATITLVTFFIEKRKSWFSTVKIMKYQLFFGFVSGSESKFINL